MSIKPAKQYHPAIDIMRIISICAVVLIHTTTRTIDASHNDLIHFSWTLFLNQSMRFAVPLFFIISGFVLEVSHPFNAHYGEYLKKRLSRIFIPYLTWSLLYYFIFYPNNSNSLLYTLFEGTASYQLYFIPALFLFYLLFPFLHTYYRFIVQKWVLVLLFMLQGILLTYDYYIHPLPIFLPIHTALLNYFAFVIGIVAAHHKEKILSVATHWKYRLAGLSLLLGYFIYAEGKYLYLTTNNYLSFYSQWRPDVLVYSVVFATTCYAFFQKVSIPHTWIKTLSKLSFFVFFSHIFIMNYLWYTFGIVWFNQSHGAIAKNLWFDPLFFILITGISFMLAFIVHKIPNLGKLTG